MIPYEPLPRFMERFYTLMHNKNGVVLHGEIAAWIGVSLERVTFELDSLLERGEIKRLTSSEIKKRGWQQDSIAYKGNYG